MLKQNQITGHAQNTVSDFITKANAEMVSVVKEVKKTVPKEVVKLTNQKIEKEFELTNKIIDREIENLLKKQNELYFELDYIESTLRGLRCCQDLFFIGGKNEK